MGTNRPKLAPAGQHDAGDERLIGSWSYCVVGRYHISRMSNGQFLFQERHLDGKEVFGILRKAERSPSAAAAEREFQANIFANREFCGILKILAPEDQDVLFTSFKLQGGEEWEPEVCAHRSSAVGATLPVTQPAESRLQGCWSSCSSGIARWFRPSEISKLTQAKRGTYLADIWELQRRISPLTTTWQAPFLTQDKRQGLSRWVDLDYHRHPWVACADKASDLADTPPLLAPKGWHLDNSRWKVVRTPGKGDDQGWQYALDFGTPEGEWSTETGINCCRRRLWRCSVRRASILTLADCEKPAALALDDSFRVLCERLVPGLRLEREVELLLANEWREGSFALDLLRASQATELEVGPWQAEESGGIKVRDVSLRVPCPPNPMSPESSRAHIRYRVHADSEVKARELRIEATWTMLDVPYGDYFNTVEHFSLIANDEGLKVTKAFKVVFIKSTMIQSMIEAASRSEAENSTATFQRFLESRSEPS